ncbi:MULTISPECIES: formylmethanofuran dehydrogenase subunit C [Methylococcus]|uniref:Formylmethanofuran dehydrogenase subunit C n=1 Tax=Methylococcus capsulatus TaxID=414 RepID=A0ABZ2F8M2_METCP|nr:MULTISPECIES: formylmethanofuran dehydrogenase subunit C [Methylococcus]MDF9393692.1 formylmethanofuran dehydrogenase subunit C [Methylococcus capsulatus]
MTALSFTLKSPLRQRLDVSPLVPDLLLGKAPKEIAALDLQYGNRRIAAAELFDIEGDDAESVRISGSPKLDFAGRGMARGSLIIEGDAGAYAGMHMKGGYLCVSGSTGLYAACELKGGIVEICGNAGDLLGSALPGNKKGMSEGIVIVRGDAGDRVGDHMRRGSILIEGNAGMYLGARMTAGTIAVRGRVGACAGYAMRRGTLLLYGSPVAIGATFNDCGLHTLGFLPLLLKGYQGLNTCFSDPQARRLRVRRLAGDLSVQGKGEILLVA